MLMTPQSIGMTTTPKTAITPMTGEVKKRGRPKGSCNKPKPLVHDINVIFIYLFLYQSLYLC